MTAEPSSDQKHLDAWADCGDGYTLQTRKTILKCLWSDYTAIADTNREAVAQYKREHEQPILDRETQHRSLPAATA